MTPEQSERIYGSLERIETKVDAIKHITDRHEKSLNEAHKRVGSLETSRGRMKGGMTVLGSIFTLAAITFAGWFK